MGLEEARSVYELKKPEVEGKKYKTCRGKEAVAGIFGVWSGATLRYYFFPLHVIVTSCTVSSCRKETPTNSSMAGTRYKRYGVDAPILLQVLWGRIVTHAITY